MHAGHRVRARHGQVASVHGDRARASFTLLELAVVIGLLVLLLALVGSTLGRGTIQGSQIRNAAEQLATVLRQTRQMAMDHQSLYAVSFNITNAPGSSGQVLNNRSGGHWYRVLGPYTTDASNAEGGWSGYGGYRMPRFPAPTLTSAWPQPAPAGFSLLPGWLAGIQKDFIGPKYVLPKGQVRFIALTDEDNGNCCTPYSAFEPTYPRPWFGVFTQRAGVDAAPRLYPWGGYDQGFKDNDGPLGVSWRGSTTRNPSGFYYQGVDPPVVGCVNPVDRYVLSDSTSSAAITQGFSGSTPAFPYSTLLAQGDSRPLVNGDWLDCLLVFMPDGTCKRYDWMCMRHAYGALDYQTTYYYFNLTGNHNIQYLAPGDMCNGDSQSFWTNCGVPYNNLFEASDYDLVTGKFYITLGPDAPNDTVTFPSASQALASMMPMYRVGVSHAGEVTVIKVGASLPPGTTLDPKWVASAYHVAGVGNNGYFNNLALSTSGQQLLPAQDFVTPDMLAQMQWWIDP